MELKGNHHNSSRVITKSYFLLGSHYNHILLLQVPSITAMSTRFISYLNTFNQLQHLYRLENYFYYPPPYYLVFYDIIGRDIVVSTATCYRLDGPAIEYRWHRGFFGPIQTGSGAHPASYTIGTRSFLQWPGRGFNHSALSSAKIKERIQLHTYYPSGLSLPVIGENLPLPLRTKIFLHRHLKMGFISFCQK
jgi:hypothetical protein